MDSAWISAFSAVMGSLVGGFTTFVTTYANQRSQYRRDFLSKQFAKRETLYSEFINEAALKLHVFRSTPSIVKWTTQVDW
jgi:membrane protein YqaA with SNARE-associated domain